VAGVVPEAFGLRCPCLLAAQVGTVLPHQYRFEAQSHSAFRLTQALELCS
jgi:hypothetical protein